jgi:hypothetical protein
MFNSHDPDTYKFALTAFGEAFPSTRNIMRTIKRESRLSGTWDVILE